MSEGQTIILTYCIGMWLIPLLSGLPGDWWEVGMWFVSPALLPALSAFALSYGVWLLFEAATFLAVRTARVAWGEQL